MRRCCLVLSASVLSTIAVAEIRYTATLETMEKLRVSIEVPVKSKATTFQIPNFAPGHYVLLTVANDVAETKASGPNGEILAVERVDANTYRVPTDFKGSVRFSYSKPMRPRDGSVLWQGPYEYMYVVDRLQEPCRLILKGPENCRFAVSLDPVKGRTDEYTAPGYDVLADCPVSAGDLLVESYTVKGLPHYLVLSGLAKSEADMPFLRTSCQRITETAMQMFQNELPYKRYMWHLRVNDSEGGGGGLEHLNSTNITMGVGMSGGTLSLLAHEFFHLWNVKRIRTKPLGPFDYTKNPKTGALWWLEGVTDYYADVLLARAGQATEDDFFAAIVQNVRTTRANPQRMNVSPFDASFRVGEASGGRGNSQGFGVNYYNTGWVAGLCLDTEVRYRSSGRYSLDDVMLALYAKCRDNKPGFEEGEIRNQLVRFGGSSLGPTYDQWIMKPGELPVEDQMAKMGYRFSLKSVRRPDLGYSASASKADRGMRIRSVRGPQDSKLLRDDVIVAVNGSPCDFPTIRSILSSYQKGLGNVEYEKPVSLRVRRGTEVMEVSVVPSVATSESYTVERMPVVDPAVQSMKRGWLSPNS